MASTTPRRQRCPWAELDPGTFAKVKETLGRARRPEHYLAIPPSLFETVIRGLGAAHLAEHGRVVVEKPFGRDLASARELNHVAQAVPPEDSIFRINRLFIDSWRWEGVPWYLRSGKYLPATATEAVVELKPPPQRLFADSAPTTGRTNDLRFRISPNSAIALAARVKRAGKDFVGDQRELNLVDEQPGEEPPYERLLGDAMAGDGALFTRENAVEAAWTVVDPVLKTHHRVRPYNRHTWVPKEASAIIAADRCWHSPRPNDAPGR